MECRNCGARIAEERADLGYDYCTSEACVDACFTPLDVLAVAVNKASDQYVLARDLNLSDRPTRPAAREESGWLSSGRAKTSKKPRRRSTSARIAQLEAELDVALASEADPVRRAKLVNDHNARLRQLNIRYRRTAQRHQPREP